MRIGIDGRELLGQRTGVGRYLASLCAAWLALPRARAHQFQIFTPATTSELSTLGDPFTGAATRGFTHCPVPGRAGTWWEQTALASAMDQAELDVFFAPAYSAPLRTTVPVVVTMHDVSFSSHPEWYSWREGFRRRWLAARTLARASRAIAVSAFSREEILRHFDLPADRVTVVRSGITGQDGLSSLLAEPGRSTTVATDARLSRPLVLYVGSIFNRRHLPTLLRAFSHARRHVPDAQLAIVGDDRSRPRVDLPALAIELGIEDAVRITSYVPDDELRQLYKQAWVFVFLSEYEGFGLTPLEAMAAGIPVVVADTPVASELYGDAPLRVPVRDARATARAIVSVLTDDRLRRRCQTLGTHVSTRYSWERAADETLDVLEAAAR